MKLLIKVIFNYFIYYKYSILYIFPDFSYLILFLKVKSIFLNNLIQKTYFYY